MSVKQLYFVTDFADQAVILPLLVVVVAILLVQGRWRVGAAWLLAVSGVLATLLVLKIGCYACGWLVPAFGAGRLALHSPSGHTAAAATAYGGIGALATVRSRWIQLSPRIISALAALVIAVLIGLSRLGLGAHSVSEVVVATVVGLAGAVAFVCLAGRPLADKSAYPVLAGVLLVVVVFHGRHLPAEGMIQRHAAGIVRYYVPVCALP